MYNNHSSKKPIFILIAALLISACSDGAIGVKESRAWHQTASIDVKRAHFAKECEAFGYKEGTSEMSACIERRWTESINRSKRSTSSSSSYSSSSSTSSWKTYNDTYEQDSYERLERDVESACRAIGGVWSRSRKKCV